MPITLQCEKFPLSENEVHGLWKETLRHRQFPDEQVNIRCVPEPEIRTLNKQYRGKDTSTNVLTFSYEGEHDIALCLSVAEQEAGERGVAIRDYVALLLIHAFLHATGMDHERSTHEAVRAAEAEKVILQGAGFADISL